MRDLLKAFTDLAGAVFTTGALHTQHDTAQAITSSVSTDHGRRARRTIKTALAPAWTEFAGVSQVARLRRTVTKKGKKIVEVVYLITSDPTAGPATLAAWTRGRQEIENKLHWVRDVTYQEEQSRSEPGTRPA